MVSLKIRQYLKCDLSGKPNKIASWWWENYNCKTVRVEDLVWECWPRGSDFWRLYVFCEIPYHAISWFKAKYFVLYSLVYVPFLIPVRWASKYKTFFGFDSFLRFFPYQSWGKDEKSFTEWCDSPVSFSLLRTPWKAFRVVLFNPTPGYPQQGPALRVLPGWFTFWGWHQLGCKALSSLGNWTKRNDRNVRLWIIHLLYLPHIAAWRIFIGCDYVSLSHVFRLHKFRSLSPKFQLLISVTLFCPSFPIQSFQNST